ncbi:MAG: HAMP domain-containing sensor histidine kinase [Bacteriovorax sp.]|nr:HAMP domain-containing sensor histidine kinase [Bacteriovorax sp.]
MVAAFLISILFAGLSLSNRIDSDRQMLAALTPYLATLVESSDRPELLRVVQSVSEAKNADVVLVQDNSVVATNKSTADLDLPFEKPKVLFHFLGTDFTTTQIISVREVRRSGYPSQNASLYIMNPLMPSIRNTLSIFIIIFFISILVSMFSARITRKVIKKTLSPLNQLHSEIKGLVVEETMVSEPIHIYEFEEIRHTVNQTKIDLDNAKDSLAEEKAKKLSAESFKCLIHDLHNPIAVLSLRASIANDPLKDSDTREEAASSIPRIADQILNQITAAKKNLEEEPISLRDTNIVKCIEESIAQVKAVSLSKTIISSIPEGGVMVPHDPALLKRALINLLENGVEAANSIVRVSILQSENMAMIKVCDDGPGMDEMKIPIFFQGRGQSGKANRQAFGLSSTNHIVRSHGGKLIYRKSDLGGSSFEIRLGVT